GGERIDGLHLGDDVEIAAGMQLNVDVCEWLQPGTELAASTPNSLGHRADQPVLTREQRDDPVGLAELVLAKHHRPIPVQAHPASLPPCSDKVGRQRRIFSTLMVAPPLTSASSASTSPFPTLTDLLYRLASGGVTSVELTRQSLDAIDASQPTLNAFRVVL